MVSIDTKMMNGNRVIIKLDSKDFESLERVAVKMRCTTSQAAKTLLGAALDQEAEV